LDLHSFPTRRSSDLIGPSALAEEPKVEQVFVECPETISDPLVFERKLYILRNYTTRLINESITNINHAFYFVSLSYKTITYKGIDRKSTRLNSSHRT